MERSFGASGSMGFMLAFEVLELDLGCGVVGSWRNQKGYKMEKSTFSTEVKNGREEGVKEEMDVSTV